MIFLIRIYQYIKPARTILFSTLGIPPHSCRYLPTCSQYTKNSIKRYGTIQGSILGFWRILKCNPLFG